MRESAALAPEQKSAFSARTTSTPCIASSRNTLMPLIPPPITRTGTEGDPRRWSRLSSRLIGFAPSRLASGRERGQVGGGRRIDRREIPRAQPELTGARIVPRLRRVARAAEHEADARLVERPGDHDLSHASPVRLGDGREGVREAFHPAAVLDGEAGIC